MHLPNKLQTKYKKYTYLVKMLDDTWYHGKITKVYQGFSEMTLYHLESGKISKLVAIPNEEIMNARPVLHPGIYIIREKVVEA